MIKSLLGDDENTQKEDEDLSNLQNEEKPPIQMSSKTLNIEAAPETEKENRNEEDKGIAPLSVEPFEIVEPIGRPKIAEVVSEQAANSRQESILELTEPLEIPNELEIEGTDAKPIIVESAPPEASPEPVSGARDKLTTADKDQSTKDVFAKDDGQINILPKTFNPEPTSETARKSGLAWSAAIVLFGSVVFMMILGWFADLTFGTTPWGIVGGIVVGSVIGFVQFFRTTAQILRPPKDQIKKYPLFSNQDDDTK